LGYGIIGFIVMWFLLLFQRWKVFEFRRDYYYMVVGRVGGSGERC
jgi:hypothetical protein